MKNSQPTIYRTAMILTVCGFMISLLAKCFYWSIRWETGRVDLPNWMRIRFLVFYLMPLGLMILHFMVNRKHLTQGFYQFSCVLLFGQAVVRITEYLSIKEASAFLVLEGVIAAGFLACTAENLQPVRKRWLPRLILVLVLLLHLGLTIRDTAVLTGIASENLTQVKALYFLAECALIFFDAAALLWLNALSGDSDGEEKQVLSQTGAVQEAAQTIRQKEGQAVRQEDGQEEILADGQSGIATPAEKGPEQEQSGILAPTEKETAEKEKEEEKTEERKTEEGKTEGEKKL